MVLVVILCTKLYVVYEGTLVRLLFFPSLDRYAPTEICLGYMFVNYVFSMNVFLICLVLRAVLRKYLFVVNFRKPVGVTKRRMFNFTV